MKYLPIGSIIISAVIVINELGWVEKSSLAWIVIGLAVSIILVAIYQLTNKGK